MAKAFANTSTPETVEQEKERLRLNLSSQESLAFTPGEEWRVLLEGLGWGEEIHSQILALKNSVSHSTLVL
ncbi:MAG TPA: hypothetical protein VHZ51_28700 [Ktedonobacteraceae bacterium]|nr:hypothetical protein [Ktedonobacteraceae bacterium]